MKLPNTAHRRAGFTILELIVVLGLIAIAAGFVAPSVGRMLGATTVSRSAAVVASTLREANTLAGRRRRPVRVSFDTTAKVIRMRDHVSPDTVFRQVWFNEDADLPLRRMIVSDTQVVMYPNGLRTKATSWPFTVRVVIGGERRQVSLSRGGQVRVTTP